MTILERLRATGIRRLGSPARGFRYVGPRGGSVTKSDRARILALRIPPAWQEVAIHPSPVAAVQAIGKDKAGRWQYLYHEMQTGRRQRRKQDRLVRFIAALPRMRRAVTGMSSSPDRASKLFTYGMAPSEGLTARAR